MRGNSVALPRALAFVAVVILILLFLFGMGVAYTLGFGYDSHAYWNAAQDLDHLYDRPPLARDAYLYSPAFVIVLWPLAQLPWPAFAVCFSALLAVCFFWLLRGVPPFWFVPALLACVPEVLTGNVYALMAVAMVFGVRHGAPWTFPLLTKVTPGILGLGFLLVRREWRQFVYALACTLGVVAVTALILPGAWSEWIQFLIEQRASRAVAAIIPLPVRVVGAVLAVVLVWIAARRDRFWLLPVAAVLVSPTLGPNSLTLLAAVPRLLDARRAVRPHPAASPATG